MWNKLKTIHAREEGQALVLAVLTFVMLVGAVALVIDVGDAMSTKAKVQSAADSASLAAANTLAADMGEDAAIAAALDIAASNNYSDADAQTKVTVNIPPSEGPYAGNPDYAEVVIETETNTNFASLVGQSIWEVSARAVAGGISGAGAPYGIVALNETECRSISFSGTIDIQIEGAGIYANANCANEAFYANGSVNVDTDSNVVVGGYNLVGSVNVTPTPVHGGGIDDPLGEVPEPVPVTTPVRACPNFGGPGGTITLEPGYYDCPTVSPPGNKDLVFEPGDYYFTGGIDINGSNELTFGPGVVSLGGAGFKIAGSATVNTDETMFHIVDGAVDLTGTGDVFLNAPESGTYTGIAIFQARGHSEQINLRGEALGAGWGTVYAEAANVTMVGTSDTLNLQFVVDTFHMTGTSGVHLVWDDNFLAEGAPALALVE